MRITERYEAVLKQTLDRVTVGEDAVDHELYISLSARVPQLVMVLTMAGLRPGDRIGGWHIFGNSYPTHEEIDEWARLVLTKLREKRLELVQQIERTAVGGK